MIGRVSDEAATIVAFPGAPQAIELRHLRAFVAVAEELNFSRAAERLYISQPALSRQVRTLERLVGCELLRRTSHRVELTTAGTALLDRARDILGEVEVAVSAVQAVGGELARRVARLWEPILKLADPHVELAELRAGLEGLHAQLPVPADLSIGAANANGVPCLTLGPEPAAPVTILHLHGGAHVMGSAFGSRHIAGALATSAAAGVLACEYRLAPEHPFPASLDDALTAYLWMLEQGAAPERVTVVGESSGGGLALSLLLRLKERGLPLPGVSVLFCPWIDMRCGGALTGAVTEPPEDPWPRAALRLMNSYLAGHPPDDPIVDPLAADLTGLPPMLVQAATGDRLRDEASRLVDRAAAHGVDARLELYPADAHVFQLFWSFLPEAADAIRHAGEFARDRRTAASAAEL